MSSKQIDALLLTWLARGNVITICPTGYARNMYSGAVCRSSANKMSRCIRGYRWG